MHSSTNCSPFEVVYGFNTLTPMDLIPLPINEHGSLDGKKKTKKVKEIHERVKQLKRKISNMQLMPIKEGDESHLN